MSKIRNGNLFLEIESIGPTAGQWRFAKFGREQFDQPASADPDSLYLGGVLLDWPQTLPGSLRFLPGSKPRLGKQTFRLRRTPEVREALFGRPDVAARATAGVSATDTAIPTNTTGLTGLLHWERETMVINSESPAGTYNVTRGSHGTAATAHPADVDPEIFSTPGRALPLRVLRLGRAPYSSTGYSDEITEYYWMMRRFSAPDPGVIQIEGESVLSWVYRAKLMRRQWHGRVTVTSEADEVLGVLPVIIGGDQLGASPMAGKSVTGRRFCSLLLEGFGLYSTEWTYVDANNPSTTKASIRMDESNTTSLAGSPLPVQQIPLGTRCWEVATTAPGAPASVDSPGLDDIPLSSKPEEHLLQVLLTTEDGGAHATYDVGGTDDPDRGANLGLGVPPALVNEDAILAWGRGVSGMTFDRLHLGTEGEPVAATAHIRRLLDPLLSYLSNDSVGRITVLQLADALPFGSTATLGFEDGVIGTPSFDPRIEDSYDRADVYFDDVPPWGPTRVEGDSDKKYRRNPRGEHDDVQIRADGIGDQSLALALSAMHIARHHEGIPRINVRARRDYDFEVGARISFTHPKVYRLDNDATFGIVDGTCLVAGRRPQRTSEGHWIDYELLFVGAIYEGEAYIAPSAEVASYTSGSITVVDSTFSEDDLDPIHADVQGFEVGDLIQITDEFGTVRPGASAIKITAISGNVISHDAAYAPSGSDVPSAGNIVRVASYSSSSTTQRANWAYKADANNRLGSDAAKTYKLF